MLASENAIMTEAATQLVGRVAELQVLDRVLADVRARRSCALELVGEPGIGNTRLPAELGERADGHGALVLAGSASELERELPFGLFVDALDDYVHGLGSRRLAALDDDDRAELAHVLPSMSASCAGAGPARADERYRTHRAVRRLAETLAATRRSCSSSTTCTGPTRARSSCSARWCGDRRRAPC